MDRILIISLLFVIIYIDIKKLYIPNTLNILLFILSIIFKGFEFNTIENSIIGMGLYPLPLLILYGYLSDLLGKEVFGFGDIKILMNFGYILGYSNFFDIYIYYLISFISASIIGVLFLLRREKRK